MADQIAEDPASVRGAVPRAPLVGVLGLQGAYREHIKTLESLGARTRLVRLPEDLAGLDALVIPGGESTTMTLLMERRGLLEPIGRAVANGLPTLGTCAGMILLASGVAGGRDGQEVLGALDITVRRNAWGRQVDSFEAAVRVPALDAEFPGVFIRAPRVVDIGSTEVIARLENGEPVGVKQGKVMALAFHPELSGDPRLHREFLRLVADRGPLRRPADGTSPRGGEETDRGPLRRPADGTSPRGGEETDRGPLRRPADGTSPPSGEESAQ